MANLIPILAAGILLGVFFYIFSPRTGNARLSLPPGPKPLPIIGNYKDLPPAGKLEYEHWLEFKETYGPISSVTILGQPMVLLHDRQAVSELLEKNSIKTSDRPSHPFANVMCGFGDFLSSVNYNASFKLQRKLVHQQLGTRALVSRFGDIQDEESRKFLLQVLEHPEGLREHIKTEASAIILKMTYGYSVGPYTTDPLVSLIERLLNHLSLAYVPLTWAVDLFPTLRYLPEGFPGTKSFQRTATRCKQVIKAVIDSPFDFVRQQMAQGGNRPSFVSSLIRQCSDENGDLCEADLEAIKLSAGVMFVGGADTTVSVISSMILAMLLHPDVQQKAQREIDDVIGHAGMPQLADRERLPYVTALVKESFRWIPVVPTGTTHVASEEIIYKNYRIPKGAYLLPQIWWFLHDPEVYTSPDEFEPERFLSPRNEPDPATEAFGYGRRACPGRYLAEDSTFLTIARILAVFDISKLRDQHGKEIEFEIEKTVGLICRPGPFPYVIKPRSDKHAEVIRSFKINHGWNGSDVSLLGDRLKDLQNVSIV